MPGESVTYLPEVECTVEPGFLKNMVQVSVADENNDRQYLEVHKNVVVNHDNKHYLPVGLVRLDYENKKALIELPREADSGVNRLWIPFSSFREG